MLLLCFRRYMKVISEKSFRIVTDQEHRYRHGDFTCFFFQEEGGPRRDKAVALFVNLQHLTFPFMIEERMINSLPIKQANTANIKKTDKTAMVVKPVDVWV